MYDSWILLNFKNFKIYFEIKSRQIYCHHGIDFLLKISTLTFLYEYKNSCIIKINKKKNIIYKTDVILYQKQNIDLEIFVS